MAKIKKTPDMALESAQSMTDEQFSQTLEQKIAEAARKHEWIYEWSNPLILGSGQIHFDPPRFEKFEQDNLINFSEKGMSGHEEERIRAYFGTNPGTSLTDYLKSREGVRNPEFEGAVIIMAAKKDESGKARILPGREMLDFTRGRTSWAQHWQLRGPDHLYQTFEFAFALDASRFAGVCESSLEEVERLDSQTEIEALNEIQSVMLKALWAHRNEAKGEVRRRVEEVIQALKESLREMEKAAAWILPTIEEVNESGDTPEERIRFAGAALLNEGRILATGEEQQDTLSWRQLLKKWPLKTDEEHPYTLGELLAEMYRRDDDITLKTIRGNCDREAVNGGPEKDAWEDFLNEVLRLVRQWESDVDEPKPDLAATKAAIHMALGIEDKIIDHPDLINIDHKYQGNAETEPKPSGPIPERWAGEKAAYKEFLKGRTRDIGFASIYDAFRRQSQLTQNLSVKDEQRLREVLRKIHQSAWLDIH